jgi:hypothetical protein
MEWKMTSRAFRLALLLSLVVAGSTASWAGIVLGPVCGDVNGSSTVTSNDALLVLRKGVGQSVALKCGDCPAVGRYGVFVDQPVNSGFSAGYLLGHRITIGTNSTVTHLGVFTKSGGPNVQLGLYTDVAGVPATLLVESVQAPLVAGSQEIPVAATPVSAGTYWMVGLYDSTAQIAIDDDLSTQTIRYRAYTAGTPLPGTFGPSTSYTGATFSYWIKVIE